MCHGKQQCDRVDGKYSKEFSQQDFQVGSGQGKQQFVCAHFFLIGPGAHGNRRDNEQQQQRVPQAQLIEVCLVVREKLLVKCCKCAGYHEHDDKQITQHSGKVTLYVSLEYGQYNVVPQHNRRVLTSALSETINWSIKEKLRVCQLVEVGFHVVLAVPQFVYRTVKHNRTLVDQDHPAADRFDFLQNMCRQ